MLAKRRLRRVEVTHDSSAELAAKHLLLAERDLRRSNLIRYALESQVNYRVQNRFQISYLRSNFENFVGTAAATEHLEVPAADSR